MELYGSLSNISGSVTASHFTGSFVGDGSGLYNLPASSIEGLNLSQIATGSITASVSPEGFNVNSDTSITGSLIVNGKITAEEFNVTIVSSSVLYQSGSTRFGDSLDDNHDITGSVNITGSISLNGEPIGTGKLNETVFNSYTSSNDPRVSSLEIESGSIRSNFNSFTSSYDTVSGSFDSRIDNLETFSSSLDVTFVNEIEFGSHTSSVNTKLGLIETSTSSLNLFTSSTDTRLGVIENTTSSLNTFTSSTNTRLNTIEISTSSLNDFTSSTDIRLEAIETTTGSLNSYTSSTNTRLNTIEGKTGSYATTGSNLFIGNQTHSGSILPSVDNTYDLGSAEFQWRDVYISSGSLYIDGTKVISSTTQELTITTDNGQSLKILEGTTDSIVLQTADGDIELKSSADGDILLDPTNGKIMLKGPVEILNGSKIQSSVGGTPVVFANDIVVSGSIDITGTIEGIDLTAFSSSVNTRLSNLETSSGSLNVFTSSISDRVTSIETSTASLNNFTSSINTTIKSKLDNDGVISGSSQIIISGTTGYSSFSSSISTTINDLSSSMIGLSSSFSSTDILHETRLNTIESRYATTGSNVFIGNQTITGSLYISQNLIVQGESSVENITASAVSIGTNTIILNTDSPAVRYAGISVFDSGSTNITASLFYDSLTNNWKFQHSDVGTDDASILLYGPLGTGIDNAPTLDANYLTKVEDNGHGHHLTTSSVFDNGSKISLKNNTEVTGSLIVTSTIVSQGTTLVSGSGQISYAGITNIPSGIISGSAQVVSSLPAGTVSGSSQVLNGSGVWSGSAQLPSGIVSGSSQITFGSISNIPSGLVSGSSQVSFTGLSNIPGGLVSGSVQVDLTSTTNYISGIKTRLNAEGVISGSSQISLTSTQITNGLGYTPYNSTNPNGYISSYTETDTLATVTSRGASTSTTTTIAGVILTTSGAYGNIKPSAANGSVLISDDSGTTGRGLLVNNNGGAIISTSNSGQAILDTQVSGESALRVNGDRTVTSTGKLSVYYNDTAEPFVQSHFYNSSTTSGTQYGGTLVSGINQAHIRFQVGTNTWGATGAKQWQIRVGNGSGEDNMKIYSWTYGGDILTLSSTGAITAASTFSSVGLTTTGGYTGSGGSFSHNIGNPTSTTELFVHNGANTPVPFRLTKAGYSGAGGSYGILQLYMNDNTNGNGANLYFCANSSNGTFTEYGGIGMQIKSNTAGSATARLYFYRQERGINGTFDSDGTLYTVGNIYVNGNGTTTGTQVVYNSGTWSINVSGNAGTVTNGVYTTSNNTLTGGNKIVIQNSQDGGSGRGIFMWNSSDPNWGIYMSQAGSGKALNDGSAPSGLDGRTEHAIRFRVANSTGQIGFLWENSDNTALMQLQPNTGHLYTLGGVYSRYNMATGVGNNSFNVSKSLLGNIHMRNGDGTSGNNNQAGITFQGGSTTEAQAGIYVSNNNSTGTAMGFATTDSYATGPQLFMTATNTGVVNFPRARPTYAGNTILDGANYRSYNDFSSNLYTNKLYVNGASWIVFNNEEGAWGIQTRTTTSTANLGSALKNIFWSGGGSTEGIAFTGTGTGAAAFEVANNGNAWVKNNLTVGGTLTENSSIRYKTNIETITSGLDKVIKMRGVSYIKKETNQKEIGVIAEEIAEILPDLIIYNSENQPDSVSYGRITAVLIEAIKELKQEINELKNNG